MYATHVSKLNFVMFFVFDMLCDDFEVFFVKHSLKKIFKLAWSLIPT